MSRGFHNFDPYNLIIFSHIENDVFGDSFVNDILCFIVKPDVEEIRFIVVCNIHLVLPFSVKHVNGHGNNSISFNSIKHFIGSAESGDGAA